MRTAHQSTISELSKWHKRLKSLDAVRYEFDISHSKGTLSRIMRSESVSADAENRVRLALGMKPCDIPVPPCPDCGSVHTGRCHGLPVASVVVLQPGDVVRHNGNGAEHKDAPIKRKRKPRKPIDVTPETHGKHALLKEGGQTWDDLENEMADITAQLDAARLPGENRVDCVRRLTDGLRTKVV